MPTGLAMARGFSASTSGPGGGKSTEEAVSSDAGVAGMSARVKNWFCTAAQTILFGPEVYSVRGGLETLPEKNLETHPEKLLLSNQPFSRWLSRAPSCQKRPTNCSLSSGPIGVAVPTFHAWDGKAMGCADRFSKRAVA